MTDFKLSASDWGKRTYPEHPITCVISQADSEMSMSCPRASAVGELDQIGGKLTSSSRFKIRISRLTFFIGVLSRDIIFFDHEF